MKRAAARPGGSWFKCNR